VNQEIETIISTHVTPKTITKTAVRNIVQIRQNTSTFSDVQGYKNLKLCSINCRSVKNKTLSICDFVLTNDYDLVALTETWLGSSVDEVCVSELVPSGYEIKHVPRCGRRRGGGVAVIYKSALQL